MKKIDQPNKQAKIALKKAQSNINNVIKMIDQEKYCVDILIQISATEGLIRSASEKILKNHLRTCFFEGMKTGNAQQKENLVQEVLKVVNLNTK